MGQATQVSQGSVPSSLTVLGLQSGKCQIQGQGFTPQAAGYALAELVEDKLCLFCFKFDYYEGAKHCELD